MELLRDFLNNSGENSYFAYIIFLLAFIIFIFSSVAFMDFMIGKLFKKQED